MRFPHLFDELPVRGFFVSNGWGNEARWHRLLKALVNFLPKLGRGFARAFLVRFNESSSLIALMVKTKFCTIDARRKRVIL